MPKRSPTHKLLIRADAGPKQGAGHVMRCLALGQAWQKMGGQVTLLTGPLPARLSMRLNAENINLQTLPPDTDDHSETLIFNQLIEQDKPDWVVLDGYQFGDEYQQNLKLKNARLLAIDDYGHGKHGLADAIFNQNAYASGRDYLTSQSGPEVIAGLEYVLLRDEFLSPKRSISELPKAGNAKRILLTFGGSDPNNTTDEVLQVLNACAAPSTSVDVIVGPCNPHIERLKVTAKRLQISIRFHSNVDRMSTLFDRTDLAITAAGSTCYELCHAGVPMIAIPIAPNQEKLAHELCQQGAAQKLTLNDLKTGHAKKVIGQCIRDSKQRQALSETGFRLVDGQGAARLARRLCSHLYHFRLAQDRDASLLLDWHNDSEIRATRLGTTAIEENQLLEWILNQINDDHQLNWIIENHEGRPVGQIHLDSSSENRTVIRISLTPSMRGKGIGTALIEAACRKRNQESGDTQFFAHIKPIDIASQTAFRKAGFKPVATKTIHGQVALELFYQAEMKHAPSHVAPQLKAS